MCKLIPILTTAVLLTLSGCGESGEKPAAAPVGAAARGAAKEVEQPLKGRDVSRASELVGVWMRTSEGELLGLEFLKNDQVIVTLGRGSPPAAMTMNYTLLDGGRLSLVAGGGATTLYQTTRNKDMLELTPETAGAGSRPQRFLKLASGQTLTDGLKARAAELDQERMARAQALGRLLKQEGLIIRPPEGGTEAWVAALAIADSSDVGVGFEGTLTLDPNINRADVLRPMTVHPFRASTSPADEFTGHIRVAIDIGPAQEPGDEGDVRGRIELLSTGSIESADFTGTANIPNRFAPGLAAALQRDNAAAEAVEAALAAQRAARAAVIKVVTDAVGGRVVLRGEKTSLGGGAPVPIEVTIEIGADQKMYTAVVTAGGAMQGRGPQTGQAAVGLVLGRGALYVALPTGEQWRLHVEEDGSLKGPWRPNPRADFISSGNVALAVERVWTVAEVEAERAAIARFMKEGLSTPRRFTGLVTRGRGDDVEYHPVTLTLAATPDGAVTGELWSLGTRTGGAVAGRISGSTVSLAPTGYLAGSEQNRAALQQRLNIQLTAAEPTPTFIGQSAADAVELTLNESDSVSAASALEELRGKCFRVTNTSISRKPDPTYLLLDDVITENALTGVLVGYNITGSTSNKLPPALVRIEPAQDRGHQILRITLDSCPQTARGYESERFSFTGVVRRAEESLLVQAWDAPQAGNIAWWRMESVASEATITISQEEQVRLAAQRMGAVVNAPADAAAGQSVLMLIAPTARDLRVGQFFFADGRYAGSSIAAAAVHAGVARVDELAVVRVTYADPFTAATEPHEQNGTTSSKGLFKPGNRTPSYTIERVEVP